MGQRVLQPIVNQQVSHVLSALDREVQNALSTSAEPPTGTSGAEQGTSPLEQDAYEKD